MSDKLSGQAISLLDKIKPTDWRTLNTEAIKFDQDFRWLDNDVMQAEQEILDRHNEKNKIILIEKYGRNNNDN